MARKNHRLMITDTNDVYLHPLPLNKQQAKALATFLFPYVRSRFIVTTAEELTQEDLDKIHVSDTGH